MIATRVIPCLLLKERGFVKTVGFKNPSYLGDPINIVRIFNDKEVDELVLLDISATRTAQPPDFEFLGQLATECFMPVCYGGGIQNLEQMSRIFALGFEKIALNTGAVCTPELIATAAAEFGSQSVIASLDVRRNWRGHYEVWTHGGTRRSRLGAVEFARVAESQGAGEILVNSIERDGAMAGYDLDLITQITASVNVPVIACGGAGSIADLRSAVEAGASAAAAGSLFVYHGRHRAVLINYPTAAEISSAFGELRVPA